MDHSGKSKCWERKLSNDEDNGLAIYIFMGLGMGLISHYLFGWAAWVAMLIMAFGPAVVAIVFLIGFLMLWNIMGD